MQHTHAHTRPCPACGGFPVAAVTTGARHRDGSRVTIRVTCPACHGRGYALVQVADSTPVGK
ncbi:hypothetical protein [Streptomyces malaysiensis]|uniref:Uncharacterized protein n=1 Tax=Streptomyces malaysiensis subsp. samsunensis TaxID=459658 RepID=A0A9X2LU71_STRMQ|nr:hypothetical protein [Streptomyces samsunensis]MCQ8830525.1 hypothetical protein [Streptomyces samsunensis]